MPPRIKFLEALGTIADERIFEKGVNEAIVKASEGDREYRVYVNLEEGVASSDDNGTTYRNYIGYPIIALLIKQGKLPYDAALAEALKGIKWRSLNERYKSYRRVEQLIKQQISRKGINPSRVDEYIREAESKLMQYRLRKV